MSWVTHWDKAYTLRVYNFNYGPLLVTHSLILNLNLAGNGIYRILFVFFLNIIVYTVI